MRRRFASTTAAAAVALSLTTPAAAGGGRGADLSKATLDYTVSSITCTLTTPDGAANVPCSSQLWSVTLQPGWSATIAVTYDYRYTDDGLALDRPGRLLTGFGGERSTMVESAGIYVQSMPTCPRGACSTLPPGLSGDTGLFPVFLSENDVPDDVTGSRTLTLTASWSPTYPDGYNWTGAIGYFTGFPVYVNSVESIPEPSTWALFGVSLAALALFRRRQTRAG